MDKESYNKALDDIRNELVQFMQPHDVGTRYSVQVVQWKQIEKKIEELKSEQSS